jgi:hypothetical protein
MKRATLHLHRSLSCQAIALSKRHRLTISDYAVVALCPSLIVLLLSSLVYFVILCVYQGGYSSRLGYIWFMFILGTVNIARLSIEQSRTYATGYAAVLGIATFFVLSRFQTLSGNAAALAPVVNFLVLAGVWFLADRITYDCTLIDDDEDASGQGLLDGLSSRDEEMTEPVNAQSVNSQSTEAPHNESSGVADGTAKPRRQKKKHQPGRTVLWLTAAALPIFGAGQVFLRTDPALQRSAMFALAIYLFATLSLLVATSFLGVRRYLRQRGVEMPSNVSTAWLGGGIVTAAIILMLCFALPQPGQMLANLELPTSLESPDWLKPSKYGWGAETAESGDPADSGGAPATKRDGESEGKSDGEPTAESDSQESQSGQGEEKPGQSGVGKGNQQGEGQTGGQQEGGQQQGGQQQDGKQQYGGQQGGKQEGGKQQGGKQQGGEQQGGEQQGGEQQGGKQPEGSDQQQGGKPQGEQQDGQKSGDSNASDNQESSDQSGKQGQSDDQKQPGQQGESSDQGDSPNQESESQKEDEPKQDESSQDAAEQSEAETEPSEPSQISQWLPSLSNIVKAIIYLVLIAILAAFLWINRTAIADFWRRFTNWLAGRKGESTTKSITDELSIDPAAPPRPFASFTNPLTKGVEPRRAVIETFQATEAWYREQGQPRRGDETPQEYTNRLSKSGSADRDTLSRLADAYNRIVYGGGSADQDDLQSVKAMWQSFRGTKP